MGEFPFMLSIKSLFNRLAVGMAGVASQLDWE
jgi:hypothetical protein